MPTTSPLGPWNPGITSTLPRRLWPRTTVFDRENCATPLNELAELAKFSGLPMQAIAELTPKRLLLHEILIRVMAELTIDDGPLQSDLGANFRKIVTAILDNHFKTVMPRIDGEFNDLRKSISAVIVGEISRLEIGQKPDPVLPAGRRRSWLDWLGPRRPATDAAPARRTNEDITLQMLQRWQANSSGPSDPVSRAAFGALARAGRAIAARQDGLGGRGLPLQAIATALAINDAGARRISELAEPTFYAAVAQEGFRRLPPTNHPVVMNTKGASAAGKSTLRPQQRELARRIGVPWSDFAIISPDIWRKQLLDYTALGEDFRWAGTLAGYEVEIIDRKLDRHIARRAAAGIRTHLLIDRFRFDSFAPEDAEDDATQLLTRFGSEVYMFFMITPPEATVERAWFRGERVGRYKAVDDLLAHNVEAYSGMPGLFFRWLASPDKSVHYEFLDNSVAEGERPRTIAFGRNNEINILDVDRLIDIDRFKAINIEASQPEEIYTQVLRECAMDLEFLTDCIKGAPRVVFAEHGSGEIYMEFSEGTVVFWRGDILARAVGDGRARAYLLACAEASRLPSAAGSGAGRFIQRERYRTLGAWGAEPA